MKSVKKVMMLSLLTSSAVVFANEIVQSETLVAVILSSQFDEIAPDQSPAEELNAAATSQRFDGCSQEELDQVSADIMVGNYQAAFGLLAACASKNNIQEIINMLLAAQQPKTMQAEPEEVQTVDMVTAEQLPVETIEVSVPVQA